MAGSLLSDVRLGPDGDFPDFTSFITGVEAVVQRIEFVLNTHRGEWFADPDVGIPYERWQTLKPLPRSVVQTGIRRALKTIPSLTSIRVGATPDNATRTMNITTSMLLNRQTLEVGFAPVAPSRSGNYSFSTLYYVFNNVRNVYTR